MRHVWLNAAARSWQRIDAIRARDAFAVGWQPCQSRMGSAASLVQQCGSAVLALMQSEQTLGCCRVIAMLPLALEVRRVVQRCSAAIDAFMQLEQAMRLLSGSSDTGADAGRCAACGSTLQRSCRCTDAFNTRDVSRILPGVSRSASSICCGHKLRSA